MDRYYCTRCGTDLNSEEYKNNVCLCSGCKAVVWYEDYVNVYRWKDMNNVDNILEMKRMVR